MKKVALYSRVSTQEQREKGLSVAAQRQALLKYCEEKGYTVYEEYLDEGVSAGALKKRKGMNRLLDDCRAGKIELILFTKLDRWFRHVGKYHTIQEKLNEWNVPWIAIQEPMFETVTAMGKANINFYLTTAQMEVDKTSERVKEVIRYKLTKKQALCGNLPLGYKIGEDKTPIIDPVTLPIARYILFEYENVQSIKRMVVHIQDTYGYPVTHGIITSTLKNKRYTGFYKNDPEYFPPVITHAQWEKNQKLLERNIRHRTKKDGDTRTYLFTGLLRCKDCGRLLSSAMGRKKPNGEHYLNYRCYKNMADRTCVNNKVISEIMLEKMLLARVKTEIGELKIQAELMAKSHEEPEIDVEAIKDELERLNYMYQKRRISDEKYDAECEVLEAMLNKASFTQPTPNIEAVLSPDFEEVYKASTKEEKRLFWRDIINTITIKGRDFEVDYLL